MQNRGTIVVRIFAQDEFRSSPAEYLDLSIDNYRILLFLRLVFSSCFFFVFFFFSLLSSTHHRQFSIHLITARCRRHRGVVLTRNPETIHTYRTSLDDYSFDISLHTFSHRRRRQHRISRRIFHAHTHIDIHIYQPAVTPFYPSSIDATSTGPFCCTHASNTASDVYIRPYDVVASTSLLTSFYTNNAHSNHYAWCPRLVAIVVRRSSPQLFNRTTRSCHPPISTEGNSHSFTSSDPEQSNSSSIPMPTWKINCLRSDHETGAAHPIDPLGHFDSSSPVVDHLTIGEYTFSSWLWPDFTVTRSPSEKTSTVVFARCRQDLIDHRSCLELIEQAINLISFSFLLSRCLIDS